MTKTKAARVLLIVVLLSAGVESARAAQRPRARDRGGVSLVLAVKADAQHLASSVARTAAVIRKRCAGLRIRCELRPQTGDEPNRLLLRFSPAADAERVTGVLLSGGLELRAVISPPNPAPVRKYATRAEAEAAARGGDVFYILALPEQEYLVAERPAIVTGDDLRDCAVLRLKPNPRDHAGFYLGGYEVDCRLRPAGAARLRAWTRANINRYLAVVLHGSVIDVPYVRAPVWLNVAVHAGPDRRRAEEMALIMSSGNLPAPVELLEQGRYGR